MCSENRGSKRVVNGPNRAHSVDPDRTQSGLHLFCFLVFLAVRVGFGRAYFIENTQLIDFPLRSIGTNRRFDDFIAQNHVQGRAKITDQYEASSGVAEGS